LRAGSVFFEAGVVLRGFTGFLAMRTPVRFRRAQLMATVGSTQSPRRVALPSHPFCYIFNGAHMTMATGIRAPQDDHA
jgi:hypothetical protein